MQRFLFTVCTSFICLLKGYAQNTIVHTIVRPYDYEFFYDKYPADYLYYKTKLRFTGNLMSNGGFKGEFRFNGNLHMRGWFRSYKDYNYIPDGNFITTLYDINDSLINLQLYFDGLYTIKPGQGFFTQNKRRYKVSVLNEIAAFGRSGNDMLTNLFFIRYFKDATQNGTADTSKTIVADKLSYDVWYLTKIKGEKVVAKDPDIVKPNSKSSIQDALLNATMNKFAEQKDINFYITEKLAGSIEGVTPFTKTLYPSTDKWELYQLVFLVPTEYVLNLKYQSERTFYLNGKRVTQKINTAFEKFDLKNGVTGFRQVVGLPEKVEKTCCPSIKLTISRSGNSASVPLRLIVKKKSY